jgi:hypothetical protein
MSKRSTQRDENRLVRRRDIVELVVQPLTAQLSEIRLQIQEVHDLIEIMAREIQRQASPRDREQS